MSARYQYFGIHTCLAITQKAWSKQLNLKEGADTPYAFVTSKIVSTKEFYLISFIASQHRLLITESGIKEKKTKTKLHNTIKQTHSKRPSPQTPLQHLCSLLLNLHLVGVTMCYTHSPVLTPSVWQWAVQEIGVSAYGCFLPLLASYLFFLYCSLLLNCFLLLYCKSPTGHSPSGLFCYSMGPPQSTVTIRVIPAPAWSVSFQDCLQLCTPQCLLPCVFSEEKAYVSINSISL